jgi:hypothetical protein
MAIGDRIYYTRKQDGTYEEIQNTPQSHLSDLAVTATTGVVTDDDSAASNGTDVVIVPIGAGPFAYLESTMAGNADTYFEVGDGGPKCPVNDNDSPGSIVLYIDEDATDADKRFLCVSPTGDDLFVPCSDGSCIRVAHDASAASNGVAVHIDDNASNAYEKLLFVSPTDADATFAIDDEVAFKAVETVHATLNSIIASLELNHLLAKS